MIKDLRRRLRRLEDIAKAGTRASIVMAHPYERNAEALARVFGAAGPPASVMVHVMEAEPTPDEWERDANGDSLSIDADHHAERERRYALPAFAGRARVYRLPGSNPLATTPNT